MVGVPAVIPALVTHTFTPSPLTLCHTHPAGRCPTNVAAVSVRPARALLPARPPARVCLPECMHACMHVRLTCVRLALRPTRRACVRVFVCVRVCVCVCVCIRNGRGAAMDVACCVAAGYEIIPIEKGLNFIRGEGQCADSQGKYVPATPGGACVCVREWAGAWATGRGPPRVRVRARAGAASASLCAARGR